MATPLWLFGKITDNESNFLQHWREFVANCTKNALTIVKIMQLLVKVSNCDSIYLLKLIEKNSLFGAVVTKLFAKNTGIESANASLGGFSMSFSADLSKNDGVFGGELSDLIFEQAYFVDGWFIKKSIQELSEESNRSIFAVKEELNQLRDSGYLVFSDPIHDEDVFEIGISVPKDLFEQIEAAPRINREEKE